MQQVVLLQRVVIQIEQQLLAGLVEPHVFGVAVHQIVIAVVGIVLAGVLAVQRRAPGYVFAAHQRQHAAPGDRLRDGQAGCVEEGRHHVLQADRAIRDNSAWVAHGHWGAGQERHPRRRLEGPGLGEHVLVAEHLAVVRREQDEGFLQ